MRIKWVAVAALVSAFLAPAVGAKDRALIVDLSNYKHLRDLPASPCKRGARSGLLEFNRCEWARRRLPALSEPLP